MKRILLVEDEPTTREILAEVLRGEGYTVDTVAGVSAANVCLGSLEYELVVADWLLQGAEVPFLSVSRNELASHRLGARLLRDEAVRPDRLPSIPNAPKVGVIELGVGQVAPAPARVALGDAEADISQISTTEVGMSEVRRRDPAVSERGSSEVSPAEVGPHDVDTLEGCEAKIGADEDVALEPLPREVGAREVSTSIVTTGEGYEPCRDVRPNAHEAATASNKRLRIDAERPVTRAWPVRLPIHAHMVAGEPSRQVRPFQSGSAFQLLEASTLRRPNGHDVDASVPAHEELLDWNDRIRCFIRRRDVQTPGCLACRRVIARLEFKVPGIPRSENDRLWRRRVISHRVDWLFPTSIVVGGDAYVAVQGARSRPFVRNGELVIHRASRPLLCRICNREPLGVATVRFRRR